MAALQLALQRPLDPDAATELRKIQFLDEYSIVNTALTMKLEELIRRSPGGFGLVNSAAFSWNNPQNSGVPLNYPSPLPTALDQEDRPECIPYAVRGCILFQMNLISKLTLQGQNANPVANVPGVALPHLTSLLENLGDKTMKDFLPILHHDGFVADAEPLDPNTGQPLNENAPRFYIHWCWGFARSRCVVADFHNLIKDAIMFYGGVLAEIKVTDRFLADQDGEHVVTTQGTRIIDYVMVNGVQRRRPVGHAVLVVGWRNAGNTVEFEFLNSYGEAYGQEGRNWCRSNTIEHVYVPQVLQWYA